MNISFSICALLTIQHSTLTRYPENGKNPFEVYTSKLPLIKKQPLFMNLLEDAIKLLKRHSSEPKFIEKFAAIENFKKQRM